MDEGESIARANAGDVNALLVLENEVGERPRRPIAGSEAAIAAYERHNAEVR